MENEVSAAVGLEKSNFLHLGIVPSDASVGDGH